MAHPYKGHSENAVAHRRANKILTGSEYKRGGSVGSGFQKPEIEEGEMTAGAMTGVGALQKANNAARDRKGR